MAKGNGKGKQLVGGHPTVWESDKVLKKYYKKLDIEEVVAWVEALGKEFKVCDDPSIFRMRACMAILYHFFPKEPSKGKKQSKYSAYTLEQLVSMASEYSVPVEVCEDERILRMRVIMALRASGKIE